MSSIRVEVVLARPDGADVRRVTLPAGSRVADALAAAGLAAEGKVGIFGREVERVAPLADGDRVEIYRELALDPKEARRQKVRAATRRGYSLPSRRGPTSRSRR